MGLSIDEREAILIHALSDRLKDGYFVQTQTPTTAQLLKPRTFDAATAFFCTLLCGVGVLVYIAAHFSHPYDALYVSVDEQGQVVAIDRWSR